MYIILEMYNCAHYNFELASFCTKYFFQTLFTVHTNYSSIWIPTVKSFIVNVRYNVFTIALPTSELSIFTSVFMVVQMFYKFCANIKISDALRTHVWFRLPCWTGFLARPGSRIIQGSLRKYIRTGTTED